jgi:protein-S-isoprenylcysteine O-methyltransferase Ste14
MRSSGISDLSGPDCTKVGAWLFRNRTSIPVPFAVALLLLPPSTPLSLTPIATGVMLTIAGEALRVWAVHHIGVISRTRSDRLGPLVVSGPFAMCRNPLYVGNIAIWVGFALTARVVWMAPVVLVLLAAEYYAIIRWEESLLESRLGGSYRAYAAQVPRWLPTLHGKRVAVADDRTAIVTAAAAQFSWRETLFSERGTLVAIAAGYALLWLKTFLF